MSVSSTTSFNWSLSDYGHKLPHMIVLTAFVLLVALYLFLWDLMKPSKEKTPRLPGPRGLPLVGYLPFVKPNLHQMFMEHAETYGPIYMLSIGFKKCVVISSPLLAKEVLRDNDLAFANRSLSAVGSAFSFGGNDIACASYSPQWRTLRKLFSGEMLHRANIDALYATRRAEMKKCVGRIYSKVGQSLDIKNLAFAITINMLSSMLLGSNFEEEHGEDVVVEFQSKILEIIKIIETPHVSEFFPVLARFDSQGLVRRMKKEIEWMEKIYDKVIDQYKNKNLTSKNGQKNLLQLLLEYGDRDSERPISKTQIKAVLMDIMCGGTDTLAMMLTWTMTELLLHPEVTRKVQEELTQVVGEDQVVEDFHLHKLHYFQAVLKETLRLRPPSPLLLPRSPLQDHIIGGYRIPKGSSVLVNVWAIHMSPQIWDNPSEFRPERFLGDDGKKYDYSGNNFHYLPFGSGRRMCAGLPLGERMFSYILANLLHMFQWEVPEGAKLDTKEKLGFVLQKVTPLVAIPKPRMSKLEFY